jgi:predicted nuclease of predicted toxin-antitoxin system
MYLLIDECCSDGLRTVADKLGHVAQSTKHVEALGRGQDDAVIFDFARQHGAVLVTVNAADFRDLARYRDHPGVILLPSVRNREQSRLFRRVLAVADGVLAPGSNMFLEIDVQGAIRSFRLPP